MSTAAYLVVSILLLTAAGELLYSKAHEWVMDAAPSIPPVVRHVVLGRERWAVPVSLVSGAGVLVADALSLRVVMTLVSVCAVASAGLSVAVAVGLVWVSLRTRTTIETVHERAALGAAVEAWTPRGRQQRLEKLIREGHELLTVLDRRPPPTPEG